MFRLVLIFNSQFSILQVGLRMAHWLQPLRASTFGSTFNIKHWLRRTSAALAERLVSKLTSRSLARAFNFQRCKVTTFARLNRGFCKRLQKSAKDFLQVTDNVCRIKFTFSKARQQILAGSPRQESGLRADFWGLPSACRGLTAGKNVLYWNRFTLLAEKKVKMLNAKS